MIRRPPRSTRTTHSVPPRRSSDRLLPLILDDAFRAECRASLPELPDAKRARYLAAGISAYNADVLTAEVEAARWFDTLLGTGAEPKAAANWVTSELFGALNRLGRDIGDSPVSPAQAAELLGLVEIGRAHV